MSKQKVDRRALGARLQLSENQLIAVQLRSIDKQKAKADAERQQAEAAAQQQREEAAARAAPPVQPRFPPEAELSHEDFLRCLRAKGLDANTVQTNAMGSYPAPTDPARSRKLADKYVRKMARYNDHARAARAEVAAVEFNALEAKPQDVMARTAALGLEVDASQFVERARQPQPSESVEPAHRVAARERVTQAAKDREVAESVMAAIRTRVPYDARKLTPGQFAALTELLGR